MLLVACALRYFSFSLFLIKWGISIKCLPLETIRRKKQTNSNKIKRRNIFRWFRRKFFIFPFFRFCYFHKSFHCFLLLHFIFMYKKSLVRTFGRKQKIQWMFTRYILLLVWHCLIFTWNKYVGEVFLSNIIINVYVIWWHAFGNYARPDIVTQNNNVCNDRKVKHK